MNPLECESVHPWKINIFSKQSSVATLGVLTVIVKAWCSSRWFHTSLHFWWSLYRFQRKSRTQLGLGIPIAKSSLIVRFWQKSRSKWRPRTSLWASQIALNGTVRILRWLAQPSRLRACQIAPVLARCKFRARARNPGPLRSLSLLCD